MGITENRAPPGKENIDSDKEVKLITLFTIEVLARALVKCFIITISGTNMCLFVYI